MTKKITKNTQSKIGFVLLHGAGYGSWIWEKVIADLDFPALAIDFPGRANKKVTDIKNVTLAEYIYSAKHDIDAFKPEQLIIVGHSFSGAVALALASQLPDRVKSIVSVSAAAPQSGKTYLSLLPFPQNIIVSIILKVTSGKPPESAIRTEAKGVDEKTMQRVLKNYAAESPHIWTDSVSWDVSKQVSRYYLRDESDFPHDKSIENLKPKDVFSLKTGHLAMLSQPKEVAAILNTIAGSK